MNSILSHYPKAISLSDLEQEITISLKKLGFELSSTIWGTSICSDEVNNTFNSLNKLFVGPGPFRFGGISGLPFTGKTGMLAFESHIPDDGNAFILYGPHIGISGLGVVGEINREGQNIKTTCCGSLVAGITAIKSGFTPTKHESIDYQQYKVQELIFANKEVLNDSNLAIKKVTDIALKESYSQLSEIIDATKESLKGRKLYLMGGIVINTDWDKEDYFEIRQTDFLQF